MRGLLIAMLVFLNMGGLSSLLFSARQGDWGGAFVHLLVLLAFNVFGIWLMNQVRTD